MATAQCHVHQGTKGLHTMEAALAATPVSGATHAAFLLKEAFQECRPDWIAVAILALIMLVIMLHDRPQPAPHIFIIGVVASNLQQGAAGMELFDRAGSFDLGSLFTILFECLLCLARRLTRRAFISAIVTRASAIPPEFGLKRIGRIS